MLQLVRGPPLPSVAGPPNQHFVCSWAIAQQLAPNDTFMYDIATAANLPKEPPKKGPEPQRGTFLGVQLTIMGSFGRLCVVRKERVV